MTELLTAAQMRAVEAAAIASGEVTGLELMERAGRGVVEAIFAEWPAFAAGSFRVVVLCGPGNNGGDGFVVARLLKDWGWEVEVFLYGDAAKLPPDARVNYERWLGLGEVVPLAVDGQYDQALAMLYLNPNCHPAIPRADFVVDALFGIGLTRAAEDLSGLFAVSEHELGETEIKWVAVDIPTGLCSDSGRLYETLHLTTASCAVLEANLTVTFHAPKIGHYQEDGPQFCGKVRVVDLGLGGRDDPMVAMTERLFAGRAVHLQTMFPQQYTLGKQSPLHKYSHGHALILSGPPGHGGAARLAARGALRIGAGLVTVACPPGALAENAARLDAVMLRPVAGADALAAMLEDARINALCIGPGLGVGEREAALVAVALGDGRGEPRPAVLDADALTLISRDASLFAALHGACVLTPHAGEFARLFPDIAEKLAAPPTKGPAYSKVEATREAAKRAGCVVLFKGPDTVIADPSGRCSINSALYDRAAPWLATAGSGDVLAGFITGLLARGYPAMQAAETAAWLHVEAARSFGPGLIAEDLPEELPKVFRQLGL